MRVRFAPFTDTRCADLAFGIRQPGCHRDPHQSHNLRSAKGPFRRSGFPVHPVSNNLTCSIDLFVMGFTVGAKR
jgi:hypothetical protein